MKPLLTLCLALSLPATALGQQEAAWQGKTARQWAEGLADEDVRVQWYAAYALGQIGPQAATSVEPLVGVLEDRGRNEYVRGATAWALGRIGSDAGRVVKLLTETLRSQHLSVRRNSPRALGNLGVAAAEAIPGLVELLEDQDAAVRANAAVALWKIGRHPRAIPVLAEMTRRPDGPGAYQAVVALGRLASRTQEAAPALVAALRHADPDIRRAAARSLGQIGPPIIPALQEALADSDREVRRSAVEALGWIGAAAVPTLIEALNNESPSARRAAARALGRFGPAAKAAEPALIEALRGTDEKVRQAAARALGEIRKQ
jgi:HEAT repeat protein